MRQLDLFGSLLDSTSLDKQEAKEDAVRKDSEDQIGAGAPIDGQSYTVASLAKELLATAEIKDIEKEKKAAKQKTTKAEPDLFSLLDESTVFDSAEDDSRDATTDLVDSNTDESYPAEWDLPFTQVSVTETSGKETVAGDESVANSLTAVDSNTPQHDLLEDESEEVIQENGKSNDETVDLDDNEAPAQFSDDKQIEIGKVPDIPVFDDTAFSDPIEDDQQKTASKPKKKSKEKGEVIFTDGTITVKLKNKPGRGPLITKEKKEKQEKLPQKRGRKSFKEIEAEVDLIDVPDDEVLYQKQYYPISEVAKWFRVNTSLLRFWENEFDILKPRKNRKGDRLFRPEDVKNLQLIYQLLRQRKYTIEGAKEYIKTNKKKADLQLHLTQTLQKFKSFLLDMRANLQ